MHVEYFETNFLKFPQLCPMVCSGAAMSIMEKIIWLSSAAPDLIERELLASLPEEHVVIALDAEDAARLCRTSHAALVFAHFSEQDLALECAELLRRENETIPIFLRDRQSSAADAMPLAQLGSIRIFDGRACADLISTELAIGLEDAAQARRKSAQDQPMRPAWQRAIIGSSDCMLQICEIVRLVADRRSTVLISGETGTGKEVIARALHQASTRSNLPMVAVNCSAIPENLLESELFGYVRGAFTGAQQTRTGRFEQAHKSTLFLDEIGDLPLDLQAKLLRVLQEREFQRLGSSETIKVDVRIVAASNLDLQDRVRQGLFREDLYYRLNVVPLKMPALRERPEDIAALASHFVSKICREEGLPAKALSATALPKLATYSWPGNVRQLENAIEMAVVMSGARLTLTAADFRLPPAAEIQQLTAITNSETVLLPDHGLDFEQTVSQFERNILSQALRRTGGNKKLAADMLRLKRTTLSAKVRILETMTGCALA
jgi:transcriptional regulator with GAF, ATPase, and Fis domain